jgi:hypothetical protein
VSGSGTVQGFAVSATADFEVVGGNLQITLTNTAAVTPAASAVLSNIEFNLNTGVSFNAGTGSGSSVLVGPTSNLYNNGVITDASGNPVGSSSGANISGGWGYATNVTYSGINAQFGVSSVSFLSASGVTPIGGTFLPGIGGTHPNSLNGVDFGIVSHGTDTTLDGLPNQGPLVANSAVITLVRAGGSSAIDLNQLSNVVFSYGSEQTGVPGGVITPVPEPSTVVIALSGLIPMGVMALRRLRRRQAADVS